jgi:hypothetical protein
MAREPWMKLVEIVNQERLAAQLDGGVGTAAVSAITALPPGLSSNMSDAEIAAIAALSVRARLEIAARIETRGSR